MSGSKTYAEMAGVEASSSFSFSGAEDVGTAAPFAFFIFLSGLSLVSGERSRLVQEGVKLSIQKEARNTYFLDGPILVRGKVFSGG
jgi:hypothetical protein